MKVKRHFIFRGHDVYMISSIGGFLLYAPTLKKIYKIKKPLAELITATGITAESSDDDIKILNMSLSKATIKRCINNELPQKAFHLGLALTRECTLKCLYCYAEAGKKEKMSFKLVLDSIDYAFKKAIENNLKMVMISITAGGENTIDWDLFKFCVDNIVKYQEKFNLETYLSMTTNGYYEQDKREYIAKYFNNINISLDGPPEIQNFQRPSLNGNESYLIVRESAHYFSQTIKDFIIRSTVTNLNVRLLPDIVNHFYCLFGNNFKLIFEPLVPIGRGKANDKIKPPPTKEFIKYYIEAREIGKKFNIKINTSGANYHRLVTTYCSAFSIPSFTVTPRGFVTICERDSDGLEFWYGKYSNGEFHLDNDRMESNKSYLNLPIKCKECFCKWHCAGDCPDARKNAYNRCYINRNLIKYELESLIK